MDIEVWMPVPDAPGYEVSDQGNVRSNRAANGLLLPEGVTRPCTLSPHSRGYLQVSVNGNLRLVHDLVLLAFVGPPEAGQQARHHPDSEKTKNSLGNLSWCSASCNMRDLACEGKIGGQKLSIEQVLIIRSETDGRPLTRELLSEVSGRHRVSPATVKNIKYRQTWAWLDDHTQS